MEVRPWLEKYTTRKSSEFEGGEKMESISSKSEGSEEMESIYHGYENWAKESLADEHLADEDSADGDLADGDAASKFLDELWGIDSKFFAEDNITDSNIHNYEEKFSSVKYGDHSIDQRSPIYEGAEMTVIEIVMLLLRTFIHNKESLQSLETRLITLDLSLPHPHFVPTTVYDLQKYIAAYMPRVKCLFCYSGTSNH